MNKREQKQNRRKGMTLIELVAVIAIVAVLGMVAAPKFIQMTESAKVATFEQNFNTTKAAITTFAANNAGEAPANIVDLVPFIAEMPADTDEDGFEEFMSTGLGNLSSTVTYKDGVLKFEVTGLSNKYEKRQGTFDAGSGAGDGKYTLTFNYN